jgi:hypothetical protein
MPHTPFIASLHGRRVFALRQPRWSVGSWRYTVMTRTGCSASASARSSVLPRWVPAHCLTPRAACSRRRRTRATRPRSSHSCRRWSSSSASTLPPHPRPRRARRRMPRSRTRSARRAWCSSRPLSCPCASTWTRPLTARRRSQVLHPSCASLRHAVPPAQSAPPRAGAHTLAWREFGVRVPQKSGVREKAILPDISAAAHAG